jgi:hypothetical protein
MFCYCRHILGCLYRRLASSDGYSVDLLFVLEKKIEQKSFIFLWIGNVNIIGRNITIWAVVSVSICVKKKLQKMNVKSETMLI